MFWQTICILFFCVIWKYCAKIVSKILTIAAKCPVEVGEISWFELKNVQVNLPQGIILTIDSCTVHRDSHHTKLCVLRFGDVRIEGEPIIIQRSRVETGQNNAEKTLKRIGDLAQYCRVVVNRIHVVLLGVVPDSMVHVTINTLSVEMFRSRDGWQLESNCSLLQGKVLQRSAPSGRLLAEVSLPLQISVDVTSGKISKIQLAVADPLISISHGIFEIITRWAEEREAKEEKEPSSILEKVHSLVQIKARINNFTFRFAAEVGGESRCINLTIQEWSVDRVGENFQLKLDGFVLADQLKKTLLKTNLLAISIKELKDTSSMTSTLSIEGSSDSVHCCVCFQDALWWRGQLQTLELKLPRRSTTSTTTSSTTSPQKMERILTCRAELAAFTCQLIDFENEQSTMTVNFVCFTKSPEIVELGVDGLSFGAKTSLGKTATFEEHLWGHSLFAGAILIQAGCNLANPCIIVGCDDVKIEWSEKLAKQVTDVLSIVKLGTGDEKKPMKRSVELRVTVNRVMVINTAHERSFAAYSAEKIDVASADVATVTSVVCHGITVVVGRIVGKSIDIDLLRSCERRRRENMKRQNSEEPTSPSKHWNHKEKMKGKEEVRLGVDRGKDILLCAKIVECRLILDRRGSVIDDVRVTTSSDVYLAWSTHLHVTVDHFIKSVKRSLTIEGPKRRKVPRKIYLTLAASKLVEVEMILARSHRILWRGDGFDVQKIENQLTMQTKQLEIIMNGEGIITVDNLTVTKRASDSFMTESRKAFATLASESNRVWTWAAEKFHFFLPFEFDFAEVFSEFVNIIKWLKVVHEMKKKPFTADSPLPSDLRIEFKQVILELEDDEFENKLQSAHELKEDEVYECERRSQILEERLLHLKKSAPMIPKDTIEELMENLSQKNSEIYIERWKMAEFTTRSLFVSTWKGWSMRAFADQTLHGTEKCTELMKEFDPQSPLPEDLTYSTLWARAVEFDIEEWTVNFKDYPMKYLDTKDMHFFGTLVGAEILPEGGRSLREATIPMADPWPTHIIQRNMSPLKFYYDIQCASSEFKATYGPCWEPCLSMISLMWNNISSPSKDPSPIMPFWDKMRFLLHGRLLWSCEKTVTTMLASTDPYNETELVEWCWDEFGLDWALGEVRIKSGLRIFIRTASRYDDSRVLTLPDLRLKIMLDWECAGDPHDHNSIVLCAPHKLPQFSSVDQHDSYRSFRSTRVNVSLNFDVSPGSCVSVEKMPNLLLYANTFRCIEQLLKTLTMKNRNVRRGPIFGNQINIKPQLSKHFGKLHLSVKLPKVLLTYWMSHSSQYGLRVFSDGFQMTALFKQSVQHSCATSTEFKVHRRKVYIWEVEHMSCTWWATQIHVYGEESQPPTDGIPSEDTLLLGFGRVQYSRETMPRKEIPVHKLTAHDLKMSWTAQNRNACLTIADGVHRAHLLRRILSNKALRVLTVHEQEEEKKNATGEQTEMDAEKEKEEPVNKAHRRGFSMTDTNQWMLNQLIDEVSTKLVAHCEQPSDVPIDSLMGVQQCNAGDVKALNWQIDLFNSQLVLKGCERDGFLVVSAAKAQLLQNIHNGVWKSDLLLSKKSWTALLSGMQYFAPISMTGENKAKFCWLPKEVIEEKQAENAFGDDFVQKYKGTGEAVGGVVEPERNEESFSMPQLQRIVSRCSCQIYFCTFSDDLKTDSSDDIEVPKIEENLGGPEEIGADCLTLKHNMLEATSNSEQYEMVVDIVNNLVLFVDPKKKELAEKRRRLRFESQIMSMDELRNKIVRLQSELREIVSLVRYLERQLYYLQQEDRDNDNKNDEKERRKQFETEMEEKKQIMLIISDQLATYISCHKQRQVNASRAGVLKMEKDSLAPLVRRFEVCFEDCIWKLTEHDGQIALAETQIRNFLYTRTIRMENSGEHQFEVGSIRVTNMLPGTIYKDTLHGQPSCQPAIRLFVRDIPPVGGICVKEHFEVNIAPMVAQISHRLFDKLMRFFFPGRNIHNQENLDSTTDADSGKISFTRRIASSLRSGKGSDKSFVAKIKEAEKDDIDRMRERADQINHFLYIKIPEVSFLVSYKGNKEKSLTDVDKFNFVFPLCEFHEQNWTWLDLALAVKQRCKRALVQQFMKQKLLRNRLTVLTQEPVLEAITEEEKKRIAIGTTTLEKKKKK